MTRDGVMAIAIANLPALRRVIRRKMTHATEHLLDDCAQQAMLAVLEDWDELRADPKAREEAGALVFHHMRRAVSRYLYAEARHRGAVSLNQPIGEDGAAEIGELVADGRAPDPGAICDARRCVAAMAQLSSREARVLLAIVDDVSLDAIAREHGVSVLEILSIRASAAEKLKRAAFGHAMAWRTHRPLRSFDISRFGKLELRPLELVHTEGGAA